VKLFFQCEEKDRKAIAEAVSKGFGGLPHPERISGFDGAFLFRIPDLYISDRLEAMLTDTPGLADTLRSLIDRFMQEDYGILDAAGVDNNTEQRYFSGGCWMNAIYETHCGVIVLETLLEISVLHFEDESIDEIRKREEDECHRRAEAWRKELFGADGGN